MAAAWLPCTASAETAGEEISAGERKAMTAAAEGFRKDFNVPGLSVAIARAGRLVYAEGFGTADQGVAVRPSHLFRIASISKPITSVAIFSLVEQGRLKLSNKVFGADGILQGQYGRRPYMRFIEEITVEHLLTHTCGGWQNDRSDPMFKNPQMNHRQLISWTLDNQPLVNAPGTNFAYSNFGYCVLGRVIEKVTSRSYASHVAAAVLGRCGVTAMRIAGNTRAERAPGEVAYYPEGDPYGMNVRRMDSHGGWIASATDLVRFAIHVDGLAPDRDILKLETIRTMTTPTAANPRYAKGWATNGRNWWHTGGLSGTTSIMVRTSSGFCWAALANARHRGSSGGALDRLVWTMVRAVKDWNA
jgi:CubicO group peptidase (beta-lactamase class C family)